MGNPRTALRTTTTGALLTALVASAVLATGPSGAVAAETPAAAPASGAAAGRSSGGGIRFVDIPGDGGVVLKGNVVTPTDAVPGHRYPVLVLPASWATSQLQYLIQARKFADSGYVVVSYTTRGFLGSGGEIEVAGPPDIADASRVIDWALAHTPADPAAVGMAGMSYGAGITLLAAAQDKRVRTVVALSGWGDLEQSIYGGRTQHLQAGALLGGAGYLAGRPSAEFQQVLRGFMSSDLSGEEAMRAWAARRSPANQLDRLNANGPAVMLAGAWGDTLFPPNQYAAFYEKLAGPKRLELRPGDHVTPELAGLLGVPNDTWNSAHRWLDHYLKGVDNGVDRERPVQLSSRSGGGYETYPDWKSVGATERKIALGARQRILANVDSGANGGMVILSNALDQFLKLPPVVSVPLLPRPFAAVWESGRYGAIQHVRGTARLHTTVSSTASSGTFMAYLYDVGPLGLGKLVSTAPYTFHDRTPGRPFGVDLELGSTAYDVPAGHRLTVVVDTVDPLYAEHNPFGARLTFSSPAADPSYLSVPLREE
ncbi:acyl esterase [Streptomyces sp. LP05-1]|uniref:Acyl esterase n=1 Tax=Streptomyces pyxinae TaxID=2970734 RepID=A0ABT2CFD3_9ACTN|nr:CocE/NonD family hydrolase [Streptomyces sp. LP05-1]MCS0635344.1 acyl esterase [Streptomyces sp. LP05-1]